MAAASRAPTTCGMASSDCDVLDSRAERRRLRCGLLAGCRSVEDMPGWETIT